MTGKLPQRRHFLADADYEIQAYSTEAPSLLASFERLKLEPNRLYEVKDTSVFQQVVSNLLEVTGIELDAVVLITYEARKRRPREVFAAVPRRANLRLLLRRYWSILRHYGYYRYDIPVAPRVMQTLIMRYYFAGAVPEQNQHELSVGELQDLISDFPIPIFGSGPKEWKSLQQLAHAAGVSLFGFGVWASGLENRPVLLVASSTSLAVIRLSIFMGTPGARVIRRAIGQRIAKRLKTEYKDEDEK